MKVEIGIIFYDKLLLSYEAVFELRGGKLNNRLYYPKYVEYDKNCYKYLIENICMQFDPKNRYDIYSD